MVPHTGIGLIWDDALKGLVLETGLVPSGSPMRLRRRPGGWIFVHFNLGPGNNPEGENPRSGGYPPDGAG